MSGQSPIDFDSLPDLGSRGTNSQQSAGSQIQPFRDATTRTATEAYLTPLSTHGPTARIFATTGNSLAVPIYLDGSAPEIPCTDLKFSKASFTNVTGCKFIAYNVHPIHPKDERLKPDKSSSESSCPVPVLALRMKKCFDLDPNNPTAPDPPLTWNSQELDGVITGPDATEFAEAILKAACGYEFLYKPTSTAVGKTYYAYRSDKEEEIKCSWEKLMGPDRRFLERLRPLIEKKTGWQCRKVTSRNWASLAGGSLQIDPIENSIHTTADKEDAKKFWPFYKTEVGTPGAPDCCRIIFEQPDGTLTALTPSTHKSDLRTPTVELQSTKLGTRRQHSTDDESFNPRKAPRSPSKDLPASRGTIGPTKSTWTPNPDRPALLMPFSEAEVDLNQNWQGAPDLTNISSHLPPSSNPDIDSYLQGGETGKHTTVEAGSDGDPRHPPQSDTDSSEQQSDLGAHGRQMPGHPLNDRVGADELVDLEEFDIDKLLAQVTEE